MYNTYLFLTKQGLVAYTQTQGNEGTFNRIAEQKDPDKTLIQEFEEFIQGLDKTEQTRVILVLDHSFLTYHYFCFPPISSRKVGRILEFELENRLLEPLESYLYGSRTTVNKPLGKTEIGVYTIKRQTMDRLKSICKEAGIPLHQIIPLSNLVDISHREMSSGKNHLFVSIDETLARVLVYRDGFLTGFCAIDHPVPENPREHFEEFLAQVNQKIDIIKISSNEVYEVRLPAIANSFLQVNEEEKLELAAPLTEDSILPSTISDRLLQPSITRSSDKINLHRSELFFIKEFRNHLKEIVTLAIALAACVVIFFGSFSYKVVRDSFILGNLEDKYQTAIKKYLPPGTSKSNALFILKEKNRERIKLEVANKKFSVRTFPVSKLMLDVSNLKKDVESFYLKKITYTESFISFQGTVSDEKDFDKLKTVLEKRYEPDQYTINETHKRLASKEVEFTFSIRHNTKKDHGTQSA